MVPTSSPTGPDTPAGAPLSDERALERLFRSHYSALAEEAKTHLKDAGSAAPRIVETLFLSAWDQRDQFKTTQELDAFLKDGVAHASARELSRRASAHHFGGKGARTARAEQAVDVDQSWQRIHRALHPDTQASASAIADHTRHDAASHVAGLAKKRSWGVPIAVGIIAIAIFLGATWYLNRLGHEGAIVAALHSQSARPHTTGPGQYAGVTLDDGSKVTLAPESKIVVPEHYGDGMRVISLEGAATIVVAPGQKDPFELRAGMAVIDAMGTTLVARADSADTTVTVLVKDGTATLRVGQAPAHEMAAGSALHVAADSQVTTPTPDQLAEGTSWTDSTFSVMHRPLRVALAELKRWYGTKVVVIDPPLLDREITVQAPANSSTAAISAIEKSGNLKFGYEGETMVFTDATPVAKPVAKKK